MKIIPDFILEMRGAVRRYGKLLAHEQNSRHWSTVAHKSRQLIPHAYALSLLDQFLKGHLAVIFWSK